MRVLVVDDDRRVLRFIAIGLRGAGHDVLTAQTAEEALGLAKTEGLDAIVLDVLIPGVDGFEVLRRLRSFTGVPVLAMSIDDSTKPEMLRLGANDFVAKPFDTDELGKRIAAMLNTPKKDL
jgi:two-component system KDP operon response regulator KdpE